MLGIMTVAEVNDLGWGVQKSKDVEPDLSEVGHSEAQRMSGLFHSRVINSSVFISALATVVHEAASAGSMPVTFGATSDAAAGSALNEVTCVSRKEATALRSASLGGRA
jgi:hypothetical protein